jgi:hypothetical protein
MAGGSTAPSSPADSQLPLPVFGGEREANPGNGGNNARCTLETAACARTAEEGRAGSVPDALAATGQEPAFSLTSWIVNHYRSTEALIPRSPSQRQEMLVSRR